MCLVECVKVNIESLCSNRKIKKFFDPRVGEISRLAPADSFL